ncbi:MAG: ferritin-like domain-containing protein [Aigarchaeota archaeon]|nr:ferritin-like domain-containing protein [Aigarchaeota archaeon]MCX8192309.1 ferritin-like domain-containing protein [Nitrososphaeria archaeon]MDW7986833.1 ferritin-like domain-containing protein [Nitrososphaerota archaeon]
MGKKGREIVEKAGVNVKELIDMLKKAYADEWIAFYYYTLLAKIVEGLESPAIASKIEEIAKEELEHQSELAERIIQLGDEPPRRFEDLVKIANCPYVTIPENVGDLKAVCKAIIEAEGCAIEVYNKILNYLTGVKADPVTFHIIRHILQEEVEHEDLFETILGK